MRINTILYIIIYPFIIWSMDSLNLNNGVFKKNKIVQARILYVIISLAITYLVVNFIVDFFSYYKYI